MGTTVLALLLVVALCGLAVVLVVAARRARRMHAAERALVEVARSWSEEGSSRGRVCTAARLVARSHHAFLAEPTRRGDALRVTAVDGAPDLLGHEARLDAEHSVLARVFRSREALHVAGRDDFPEGLRPLMDRLGFRSSHLRPVVLGEHAVGVLGIAWSDERAELADGQEELIAALAAEAARAIERDAHVALLARQARTDELTALPNRRAWDEAVLREMARAERTGEPLCLALLDLDHFKAFNDVHGHQAGDQHLRRTAATWRRELRTIDVLARYGGEEFGILLPGADLEHAREVVDRVRAATPGGQSASAGVVLYDGRESPDSLLARADAALYRAKHAGRSKTVPA